jgi:hypothetical protein
MGVSNEAKNVISLKLLRKIKNKNVFPLVKSIRGHTVYGALILFSFIYFIDTWVHCYPVPLRENNLINVQIA